uniref:Uncharacterized protein n=1 Tax=Cacopsylla melanoneura TaxID=428564 RepID=A0A8D9FDW2_9HEMI
MPLAYSEQPDTFVVLPSVSDDSSRTATFFLLPLKFCLGCRSSLVPSVSDILSSTTSFFFLSLRFRLNCNSSSTFDIRFSSSLLESILSLLLVAFAAGLSFFKPEIGYG